MKKNLKYLISPALVGLTFSVSQAVHGMDVRSEDEEKGGPPGGLPLLPSYEESLAMQGEGLGEQALILKQENEHLKKQLAQLKKIEQEAAAAAEKAEDQRRAEVKRREEQQAESKKQLDSILDLCSKLTDPELNFIALEGSWDHLDMVSRNMEENDRSQLRELLSKIRREYEDHMLLGSDMSIPVQKEARLFNDGLRTLKDISQKILDHLNKSVTVYEETYGQPYGARADFGKVTNRISQMESKLRLGSGCNQQ